METRAARAVSSPGSNGTDAASIADSAARRLVQVLKQPEAKCGMSAGRQRWRPFSTHCRHSNLPLKVSDG